MRRWTSTAVAAYLLLAAGALHAQTAQQLEGAVTEAVDTAKTTQEKADAWAAEQGSLENRYRVARANIAYLQDRIAVEQERATALDVRVAELQRRLDESGRLQTVIEDTLVAVFHHLESSVQNDLPFLPEERTRRLASMRTELVKPDVPSAEKLRQLLEALLAEAQYGSSVEVTQESINLDGEQTFVDMLRIGRLALFWRTPDGARVGTWDPARSQWSDLPGGDRRSVGRVMEMASRLRLVELTSLPLGRIQP